MASVLPGAKGVLPGEDMPGALKVAPTWHNPRRAAAISVTGASRGEVRRANAAVVVGAFLSAPEAAVAGVEALDLLGLARLVRSASPWALAEQKLPYDPRRGFVLHLSLTLV